MPTDVPAVQVAALRRSLLPRHLSMLALGGTVGAGLFVGSGAVIAATGPAVVLSYAAGGLVVVAMMRMLAELTLAHPSVGSFVDHTRIAIGPAAGYALGWLYWWGWVVALAFEAVAGGTVLAGRVPSVPLPVWALLLLAVTATLNLMPVRRLGESEFWLAGIKVVAILLFLAVGLLAVTGLLPGREAGLPGLAGQELLPGGWLPVVAAMVAVLFTYGGTEIVAIAAAEAEDPERTLVAATRQIVARILLFYVGSIALIVCLLPLARTPDDASPFAVVLDDVGLPAAAAVLDLLLVVALLSAMNSAIYVCSRTLLALAGNGDARPGLAVLAAGGVPRAAVAVSVGVATGACVLAFLGQENAFLVLLGTAGAISLPVYALIALSQIRLRQRRERAGTAAPAVQVWLFPYLSYAVIVFIAAVALAMALLPDFQAQLVLTGLVMTGLLLAYRRRRSPVTHSAR